MGGRGRGRGAGSNTGGNPAFSAGFGGDQLNLLQELGISQSGPKKLYPDFDQPIRISIDQKTKTLASKYRLLLRSFESNPSYLKLSNKRKDVERYSDKYIKNEAIYDQDKCLNHITTDMSFFPSELHEVVDKYKVMRVKQVKVDHLKRLEQALKEQSKKEEEEEEIEEEEEDDVIYDEDNELEGDYGDNYFDDGEFDIDEDGDDNHF